MKKFRLWLIARVAETKYARDPVADDAALEALAQKMGLQPDLLAEARVRARTLGRAPTGQNQGDRRLVAVSCAEAPYRAWEKHVDTWGGISQSDLLRSLIYAYLCGTYEPPCERLTRLWVWDGRHVTVTRIKGRPAYSIHSFIKRGAYVALVERARRLNHTVTALLRALILENMDGRFGQRGALTILDLRSMPGDPEFYLKGQ